MLMALHFIGGAIDMDFVFYLLAMRLINIVWGSHHSFTRCLSEMCTCLAIMALDDTAVVHRGLHQAIARLAIHMVTAVFRMPKTRKGWVPVDNKPRREEPGEEPIIQDELPHPPRAEASRDEQPEWGGTGQGGLDGAMYIYIYIYIYIWRR